MALIESVLSLLFISGGISFLCILAVLGVNDVLNRVNAGFLELESLLSGVFGKIHHPVERAIHGLIALFLSGWAGVIAFFVLWQWPALAELTKGSVVALALILGVTLTALVLFVLMPALGMGFMGRRHHKKAPLWAAMLVFTYVTVLGTLVSLSF